METIFNNVGNDCEIRVSAHCSPVWLRTLLLESRQLFSEQKLRNPAVHYLFSTKQQTHTQLVTSW